MSVATARRTTALCHLQNLLPRQETGSFLFFFFFFFSNCTYKLSHYHQRQRCNGVRNTARNTERRSAGVVLQSFPPRSDLRYLILSEEGEEEKKTINRALAAGRVERRQS